MKNRVHTTIIFALVFLHFLGAQKIPITSNSKEAIEIYKKGREFEMTLKTDKAEAAYKKAILLDSTFALAHYRLGMVRDNYAFRRKKLNDAFKYIEKLSKGEQLWIKARVDFYSKGYDGSKEYGYCRELVELYPNDESANYLFGFVNMRHGVYQPKKAIEYLSKAVRIKPNYAAALIELVYAYMGIEDYEKAKLVAKKVIEINPKDANSLDTYAEIFMRSGEYKKSIKHYKNVLKIDKDFPWSWIGLAANLNFLGKHEEARTYIDRINESSLSDYEYRHKWRARVVSYIDEGNLSKAIETLEKQKQASITGKNKREPSFHIYFSYLRKTRLYFENNEVAKGFDEYKKWKEFTESYYKSDRPKNRVSNLYSYYKAYEAYLKDDVKLAYEYLSKRKTETTATKVLRSKLLIKEKKYEDAIAVLKKGNKNSPLVQYWMSYVLKKLGHISESKIWRDKILNLNEKNDIDLALIRKKALSL